MVTPVVTGELAATIRVLGQHNGQLFVRDGLVSATVLPDLGHFRRPPAENPTANLVTALLIDTDNNQIDDTVAIVFPAALVSATNLRLRVTIAATGGGSEGASSVFYEMVSASVQGSSALEVRISIEDLIARVPGGSYTITLAEMFGIDAVWGRYALDQLDAPITAFTIACAYRDGLPRLQQPVCGDYSWVPMGANENGLFDNLRLQLWVMMPRGGSLRSGVTITAACGVTIGTYTVDTSLSASCQWQALDFVIPAADIVIFGIDGPYSAEWFSIASTDTSWYFHRNGKLCTSSPIAAAIFTGYHGFVDRNFNSRPEICELFSNPGLDGGHDGLID